MIGNNIPQEGLNLAPYNSLEEITLNQRALRKQNLEAVKTQQAKDAEEAVVTEFPPQAYGSDSGGYEFSPQEQRQMSKGSFTPITQEYEQSDYVALGQQVNMTLVSKLGVMTYTMFIQIDQHLIGIQM